MSDNTEQTLVTQFVNSEDKYTAAGNFVKVLGNDVSYDLAITILEYLKDRQYCIWQTYTKEDLQLNTGKKEITKSDMEDYGDRLQSFTSIDY